MNAQSQKRKGPGRPRREFNTSYCDLILRLAEEGKWMNYFCKEAKIGKYLFYKWQEDYPEFAEAIDLAYPIYEAWWEERGRRALDMPAREFNSVVWIYQMKCRFENWIEKQHVETVDKTPKATFVAPEQYRDLEQWSQAYQEDK